MRPSFLTILENWRFLEFQETTEGSKKNKVGEDSSKFSNSETIFFFFFFLRQTIEEMNDELLGKSKILRKRIERE